MTLKYFFAASWICAAVSVRTMSSYGSVMPAMSSPYWSRVVIALNHQELDLSSTSRSRMICSRTFAKSDGVGPCVCIESISANTVLLNSSTFAGDDPYDT